MHGRVLKNAYICASLWRIASPRHSETALSAPQNGLLRQSAVPLRISSAAVRRAPWPTASSVGEAHGRLPDLLERMRHLYIILMAFAAALFSCGRPDYPTELLSVDSLSEVRPDSAKAVLGRVGQGLEAFDDDARWYYRLLRLKVRGKAYDAFSAADSAEAFDVLAHYRGGATARFAISTVPSGAPNHCATACS